MRYSAPSPLIASTIVDFGFNPSTFQSVFTIADARIQSSSRLTGTMAYVATAGRDLDENEMEVFDIKLSPATGQLTALITADEGPLEGPYTLNYTIWP